MLLLQWPILGQPSLCQSLQPFTVFAQIPLLHKAASALVTLPQPRDWVVGLGLLLLYASIALVWGGRSSLLQWQPIQSPRTIATTLGIAFIFPALMEECLFRVILLPVPNHPHFYEWAGGGLILFILAHPLNALLFFPHRKATFFNPHFLGLAGLLGVMCTIAYQTSASLWLPVVLHWVPVGIWLLLWGGLDRMSPTPTTTTAPRSEESLEP